ncbi:hypothetical protein IE9_05748 [Bacillus cereus BAG4X12-1]|nr:hypothetical protein IE9_05748 [Bacillus cereus BAG4X12-1]EOP77682.1 hypothetical protein IEG_05470 [Bacillus cereus BAG5X12-1]
MTLWYYSNELFVHFVFTMFFLIYLEIYKYLYFLNLVLGLKREDVVGTVII